MCCKKTNKDNHEIATVVPTDIASETNEVGRLGKER
jgi:hypothetical protein